MSVTASPPNAEVEVVNESGVVVHKAPAPFQLNLKSSKGYFDGEKYTLRATAPGYTEGTATLDTSLNGWYWGNLLIGGIIGFFLVDPLTGAMYKVPETAHISLAPTAP